MPSHSHTISEGNGTPGGQWSLNAVQYGGRNTTMGTNNTGGGAAMSILNPYIVVNYEVVALQCHYFVIDHYIWWHVVMGLIATSVKYRVTH